jgi:hypothetical protein
MVNNTWPIYSQFMSRRGLSLIAVVILSQQRSRVYALPGA